VRARPRLIAAGFGAVFVAVAAAGLGGAFAPAGTLAADIGGRRPGYAPARLDEVPNRQAILRRFWVPGLDDGYDPQGLAVAEGGVLVSAYRSEALEVHRGPCRVFRVDAASGAETGAVDVPPPCGHAGGLARSGDGILYVADTHTLFAAPLAEAFAQQDVRFREIALGPGLIGALAVSDDAAIWLGTYREDGPGQLYRFAAADLARLADGATLTVGDAAVRLDIPSYAQGAAFDRSGRLWVARSDTRWGELARLDAASGAVERRYAAPPGIEGIAFDGDGRLWAVSEAGARHGYDQFLVRLVVPFFPLVFALDPDRLE